jgi:trimethylamine--corrinoid protein Co-methyltransferase
MTCLIPALAGANMLYGLGMLESGITIGYGQMLIDNEMAKFVRRCLKGLPVDENTEAVELIKKIGPRGQFLTQKHTRLNMRTHLYPELADRKTRENWVRAGSLTIGEKADQKAKEILASYKAPPLPDKIMAELDEFMKKAEPILMA